MQHAVARVSPQPSHAPFCRAPAAAARESQPLVRGVHARHRSERDTCACACACTASVPGVAAAWRGRRRPVAPACRPASPRAAHGPHRGCNPVCCTEAATACAAPRLQPCVLHRGCNPYYRACSLTRVFRLPRVLCPLPPWRPAQARLEAHTDSCPDDRLHSSVACLEAAALLQAGRRGVGGAGVCQPVGRSRRRGGDALRRAPQRLRTAAQHAQAGARPLGGAAAGSASSGARLQPRAAPEERLSRPGHGCSPWRHAPPACAQVAPLAALSCRCRGSKRFVLAPPAAALPLRLYPEAHPQPTRTRTRT